MAQSDGEQPERQAETPSTPWGAGAGTPTEPPGTTPPGGPDPAGSPASAAPPADVDPSPTTQQPPTATYPTVPSSAGWAGSATPGQSAPPGPFPGEPSTGWGGPGWGGPGSPGGYPPGGHWGPWGPWGPPPGGYWAPPPPPLSPRARRIRAVTGTVVAAVLAAAIGIVVGRAAFSTAAPAASSNATSPGTNFGNGNGGSVSGPSDPDAIAAKVDPGLVDIDTVIGYDTGLEGAGTGMVVTSNGEVITNNHVIDEATSIKVVDIGNGQTYSATVVGYDHNGDIAVLHLQNASGLSTVTFGDSSTATSGTGVVAIGNAGGVGGTPSVAPGTITATNQSISASDEADGTSEQLSGLLETDADIQPGDSGGPLVNASGQVVGMDTAASSGFTFEGGSSTQGYAIPVNTVSTVAKEIESGKTTSDVHIGATGFIGVTVAQSQVACEESTGGGGGGGGGGFGGFGGFGGGSSSANGAVVCSVLPSTPAAGSGLAEGDVITAVDGSAVSSPSDLTDLLIAYHPGDKVQLTYTNTGGSSATTTVTLASGPPQ